MKRVFGSPFFWVALAAIAAVVPMLGSFRKAVDSIPPILVKLPEWRLTDETGKPFGTAELAGEVYIADFVFTSCPDVCPRLTEKMAGLQAKLGRLPGHIHLVTFTVDPANDTPEKLAAYAKAYHADPRIWTFVTGPSSDVERTIVKGFKIAMGKEPDDKTGILQIFHGEKIVLVDMTGQVRGYYDAEPAQLEKIIDDAVTLSTQR